MSLLLDLNLRGVRPRGRHLHHALPLPPQRLQALPLQLAAPRLGMLRVLLPPAAPGRQSCPFRSSACGRASTRVQGEVFQKHS